ncbi:unnamed protein product [Mytilus coruscus]|uniref:Uncharacterized protein n=1 Tax=Mytilus coruscus TaxID=42192 RepID=A0A6J8C2G6_MYTCO|nr:unnamed protein product [Mytilus coruscus]
MISVYYYNCFQFQVSKWSLVLFDINGNTAKVRSTKLSSAPKSAKVSLVLGTKSLEVEVLKVAETEEELDIFEDEWEKTHQAIAIDREIARRQNLDQQEYGFLAVWPEVMEFTAESTDELVAEPIQPNEIEDTVNSEHDTSVEADYVHEEQADSPEIAILPDQPTEIKGRKSSIVKVLYQGAGDYSRTRAVPQRQPCFKGGLTQDQADMVINQVQNYEKSVVDKKIETDAVIILSDETDLQKILTNKPTPKTRSASTQTDFPGVPDMPSQILEILRIVKDIQRHFPSSGQSLSQELQNLAPFPSSDLQDLDLMELVVSSPLSTKSTPTDSFDATALFTSILWQAAITTGHSLQQMPATTPQHMPSSVATLSVHADKQMPDTSSPRIAPTSITENLSQQKKKKKTKQASTTDQSISSCIITVVDIHNFPKQVTSTPGPTMSTSRTGQISNALQHETTAGPNIQTSLVTRPRIRHLPPIDEHDIITSESDIVSSPVELVDYTSSYQDFSQGTSVNTTQLTTLSPDLNSSPDIALHLNNTTAPLPEAYTTPATLVTTSTHQVSSQATLPLSSHSSFTRGTSCLQSSLAIQHFRPANCIQFLSWTNSSN